MSMEENKAVVRRFYDALDKGNLTAVDELLAPDYVWHRPTGPDIAGRDGVKQYFGAILAAVPDFSCTIEDLFAEGDKVAVRFTAGGTVTGEIAGIPPAGREVVEEGLSIERVVDGRIAETWERYDTLSWAQKVGILPRPGAQGER